MLAGLLKDIHTALRRDPAARNQLEVLLTYPGVHALFLHRVSHQLWTSGHWLTARVLAHAARSATGVEIHPGARIADGVFIDHGMGVVIGETAVIEEGCIIYKGAVLGGTSLERKVRHPHLGKNVIVGSNACVLGAIEIGEGARIGSGSVVIRSVPAGATVVGVPGRIVAEAGRRFVDELDHASLPDPVADLMRSLASHQEALAERLSKLEGAKPKKNRLSPIEPPAHPAGTETDAESSAVQRRRAGSIF